MGLLMALWTATYFRWVRWSKVESYASWLHRMTTNSRSSA